MMLNECLALKGAQAAEHRGSWHHQWVTQAVMNCVSRMVMLEPAKDEIEI